MIHCSLAFKKVAVFTLVVLLVFSSFLLIVKASSPKLVFTVGANQSINGGQNSNLITIQRQDGNGNPITTGWNLVYLTTSQAPFLNFSTGSSGNFYYTNGSLMAPYSVLPYGTALIQPSILIPQGSSSASFFYEDDYNGNWTLIAKSDGSVPYIPAGATQPAGSTVLTFTDGTNESVFNLGQSLTDATTLLSIVNGITPTITSKSIFTESGLPTGTSWSVTLDSTQYSSTTNTITISASATSQHSWSISNSQVNGVSYSASPFGGVVGALYSSVYANGVIWGSVISSPSQQITFSPMSASTPTPSSTSTPTITQSTPSPKPTIPEFPLWIILSTLLMMMLVTIAIRKKKSNKS
jgi:hypothetical protein